MKAHKHCACGGKCAECKDSHEAVKFCQDTGKPGPCAGQKKVTFLHSQAGTLHPLKGQTAANPALARQAAERALAMHNAGGGQPRPHALHVTNHPEKPGAVQVHLAHKGGEHIATYEPSLTHEGTTGGTAGRAGLERSAQPRAAGNWFGRLTSGHFADDDVVDLDTLKMPAREGGRSPGYGTHKRLPVPGAEDNELEAFCQETKKPGPCKGSKRGTGSTAVKPPAKIPGTRDASGRLTPSGGKAVSGGPARKIANPKKIAGTRDASGRLTPAVKAPKRPADRRPGTASANKRIAAAKAGNIANQSWRQRGQEETSRKGSTDESLPIPRGQTKTETTHPVLSKRRVPGTNTGRFTMGPKEAHAISAAAKKRDAQADTRKGLGIAKKGDPVPGTSGNFNVSSKPAEPKSPPMRMRSPSTGRSYTLHGETMLNIDMDR